MVKCHLESSFQKKRKKRKKKKSVPSRGNNPKFLSKEELLFYFYLFLISTDNRFLVEHKYTTSFLHVIGLVTRGLYFMI